MVSVRNLRLPAAFLEVLFRRQDLVGIGGKSLLWDESRRRQNCNVADEQ